MSIQFIISLSQSIRVISFPLTVDYQRASLTLYKQIMTIGKHHLSMITEENR